MTSLQEKKNPRQLAIELVRYMAGHGHEVRVAEIVSKQEALLDACCEEARGIILGVCRVAGFDEALTFERSPVVCMLSREAEPWQSPRDVRQEGELVGGARIEERGRK